MVNWYWSNCKTWKATTYAEFVAVARKKLRDHLGYTQKYNEAASTVGRLFDKARFSSVEFDDVITAITFLAPTQPMPNEVFTNDRAAVVDVTLRESSPRILRVDADFLPTLRQLYPFRREGDQILKTIPTAPVLDLNFLAFWRLYPDMTLRDFEYDRVFRNGDKLDWCATNMRSRRREKAELLRGAVPNEYMEPRTADGSVRHFHRGHVSLPTEG
jgi:hypothetical protein